MITVAKARKILGSKYSDLSDETIYDIIGFMIMMAKIEYTNNTK
jgi:hypothetical protein